MPLNNLPTDRSGPAMSFVAFDYYWKFRKHRFLSGGLGMVT
jgi:hypothetical protein